MKFLNIAIYSFLSLWNIYRLYISFTINSPLAEEAKEFSLITYSICLIVILLLIFFFSKIQLFIKWWLLPIAALFTLALKVIEFASYQLVTAA